MSYNIGQILTRKLPPDKVLVKVTKFHRAAVTVKI